MNKNWLPIEKCIHGGLYRIRARNFSIGVYDEKRQIFIGIREKFGDRYLFPEHYRDLDRHSGTVKPFELIDMYPYNNILLDQKLFDWLNERIQKENEK